jgi:hypothetical protein
VFFLSFLTVEVMQPTLGPDGKIKEPESNVLLASIENMQYAVTVDVLHTVFSAFGTVQKIAMFEKNGGMQALIQYPGIFQLACSSQDFLHLVLLDVHNLNALGCDICSFIV